MAYKFSKGDRGLGDIKFEDDSDTGIDFDQDRIDLETNGQTRLKIENTTTTITNVLHLSGSDIEALRIAKGEDDYKQIVFEKEGADAANIHLSNGENLVFQNETNGKDIQFWVNPTAGSQAQAMVIKQDLKVGIGTESPSHRLDIDGDIRVRGNDIRDNSGNPAITFDGSANATIVNNLTVQNYTFPSSDGNANQVLQTNGSGQLSFVDVDDGEGGGGGGSVSTAAIKVAYLSTSPTFSGGDTNEFFISWYNGTFGNQPDLRSNNQYFLFTNGGNLRKVTAYGSTVADQSTSNPFTNNLKVNVYIWNQSDSSDIAAGNYSTNYNSVANFTASPTDVKAQEGSIYYHRAFYDADINYTIPGNSAVAVSIQGIDAGNNNGKGFNKLNVAVHFQNI
jgi:hypothetical protein